MTCLISQPQLPWLLALNVAVASMIFFFIFTFYLISLFCLDTWGFCLHHWTQHFHNNWSCSWQFCIFLYLLSCFNLLPGLSLLQKLFCTSYSVLIFGDNQVYITCPSYTSFSSQSLLSLCSSTAFTQLGGGTPASTCQLISLCFLSTFAQL